ncbi:MULTISPECIES: 6-hydroxymethylpterin diphosphokinase MptE-like protein [Pseudoalteromonas]|uniref:6-hydroxymethylpterin diphosphokinase MptE-like protein n=1 Tax=Pseudoalteromonas spongiae TaxID=298657 RepID=A0ABU8END2_9GAMM|nr:6-hydroxymethylpterin diphosphokinase MptE-like protein [Pseudoalteromonas sp. T1lg24]
MLNFLYSLMLESGVPIQRWQKDLVKFKNIHKGKTCVLVGNGPSVNYHDLLQLNQLNLITFVFNRFHKVYDEIEFEPTYTLSIDPSFIDDFFEELLESSKGTLFIGHHQYLPVMQGFKWIRVKDTEVFEFGENPLKSISPGGSVVVAAIQLAYYMGCKDIYLYGIDHSFHIANNAENSNGKVQGEGNHFIKNYRSNKAWFPPDTAKIEQSFITCLNKINSENGKLINISRESKLPRVPRMDFNDFIETYTDN